MKKNFLLLTISILLIIISSNFISAISTKGHMKLLTVSKENDQELGGTADLYLEIRPGNGRVFIDSYPLSKLDTQSSTRYAQKIACQFSELDCDSYDFLYTIRADAAIVGGPSAGAAIAILTTSLLKGDSLRTDTVITGTINSGGIIGPVGGNYAKAKAAQDIGMNFVLISELTPETNKTNRTNKMNNTLIEVSKNDSNTTIYKINIPTNKSNSSINLNETLEKLDIQIVRVITLEQAYAFMTNQDYEEHYEEVVANKNYLNIMDSVKNDLCNRSQELYEQLNSNITLSNKTNITDPYSVASLCYSDALNLRLLEYQDKNKESLLLIKNNFEKRIFNFKKALSERKLSSLAELETYLIVKERVSEAEIVLNKLKDNQTQEVLANGLSFVHERLNSANSWSAFFQMPSKEIVVNEETLQKACVDAKGEAIERLSYLALYLPKELLANLYEDINLAEQSSLERDYAYCIFKAVQTKAETNMLLSGVFTEKDKVSFFINKKLLITSDVIAKEINKNHFPIAGYSYYKYAETLKDRNPYSAMLFSEYAIELSNLDLYFPKKKSFSLPQNIKLYLIILAIFASGLFIGLSLGMVLKNKPKTKKKKNRKKN